MSSTEEFHQYWIEKLEKINSKIENNKVSIKQLQSSNKSLNIDKREACFVLGNELIINEFDPIFTPYTRCYLIYLVYKDISLELQSKLIDLGFVVIDYKDCSSLYFTSLVLKKIPVVVFNKTDEETHHSCSMFETICENNEAEYNAIK